MHENRAECNKTAANPSLSDARDTVPAAMKGLSDYVLSQPVVDLPLSVPPPRLRRASSGGDSEASRAPGPPPDPDQVAKKARAESMARIAVVASAEDESISLAARAEDLAKENRHLRAQVSELQRCNDALSAELKAFSSARTSRDQRTAAEFDWEDQTPFDNSPAGRQQLKRSLESLDDTLLRACLPPRGSGASLAAVIGDSPLTASVSKREVLLASFFDRMLPKQRADDDNDTTGFDVVIKHLPSRIQKHL